MDGDLVLSSRKIYASIISYADQTKAIINEMANLMPSGPLPSILTLLSGLNEFSPGEKVRFLGWYVISFVFSNFNHYKELNSFHRIYLTYS